MAKKKRKWRKAVRDEMFAATLREAKIRCGTQQPRFNYRWEHVTAVVTLARKLAAKTGADMEIVTAAAWLHDIRKDAKKDHSKAGAQFARKFLPKTDFPEAKIERVATAIAEHMGLWRDEPLTNLESMVLWDADKLTKIGLTAVFHWVGNDLSRQKPCTVQQLLDMGQRAAAWIPKTVASMHTEPARNVAKQRLQRYLAVWHNLQTELSGEDI